MMIVLLAEHALTSVRLKQFQKVISIKLILMYAPIAEHVLMFVRLKLFILSSIKINEKIKGPSEEPFFYFY